MFKRLFEKLSGTQPPEKGALQVDPKTEALVREIRSKSREDPRIGARLGAKDVFQRLIDGMEDKKGVHIESVLCALGALAGYSCQASLRAQASAKGLPETAPFQIIDTKNGSRYFFGDSLNNALAGSAYSVLGLAGGVAQQAGAKEFADLNEVFKHVSATVGSDKFGIPRVPENHEARRTPIDYLKAMWSPLFPRVRLCCPDPIDWPVLYGFAIREAILAGKGVIDPAMAFRVVAESAVPMSRVDLANA